MLDLGIIRPGRTVRIPFSSFDKDDGSSITMTNYAAADILVYKDGSTTERASTAGFTATTDFDSKTGKHIAVIDLSDNTTAGFWNAGSEYLVAIDAVTIDGVTTGGWIARFTIGFRAALLDTTIATLSSQTSFTLTTGPADDNALVGCVVLIHALASAVQFGMAVVTAYTGSTKTVTLAAGVSFTAAAGDNISLFVPSNTRWVSGTAQTAGDIPARLPAALTANGNIKASFVELITTALTEGAGGRLKAALTTLLDVASPVLTAASVNQTGDNYARLGAPAGASVSADVAATKALLPTALVGGRMDASVGAMANGVLTAAAIAADAITAAKIADGAIDAATFAAGALDAVWSTAARLLTAGTNIVLAKGVGVTGFNDLSAAQVNAEADTALADVGVTGTVTGRIDAAVSSRLATSGYTTPPTAIENADALLKRDFGSVSGEAARSALNALRFLRNKWGIAGGTLEVTKENDVDVAWTAAVTTTAGNPVSTIDPA